MSILAWNCRGIGGSRKQQFIKDLLIATGAEIVFLSETKSSFSKSERVIEKLSFQNYTFVPSRRRAGGLWLLWKSHIQIQVLKKTRYFIFARVRPPDGQQWHLVCVYGDPFHENNPYIWQQITNFVESTGNVCCLGDWNAIVHEEEKVGGNHVMGANNRGFRQFLFEAGLMDLGFRGPAYTWTNKRSTSKAIFQRLDRVVATPTWCQLNPNAYVTHLPRIRSDHAPILLRLREKEHRSKPFRIENWWRKSEGFTETVTQSWRDTVGQSWSSRIERLQSNLKQWAASQLTPQKRIHEIQRQIGALQSLHPSQQDLTVEEHLLRQMDEAEQQLEEYWRQRSRVLWQTQGDRNTAYFHLIATQRRRVNTITSIMDESGNQVSEEKEIRKVFVRHFRGIYSGAGHNGQPDEIINFCEGLKGDSSQHLEGHARHALCRPPSHKEIFQVLKSMGPDKAPGPDGLTARFWQDHWL